MDQSNADDSDDADSVNKATIEDTVSSDDDDSSMQLIILIIVPICILILIAFLIICLYNRHRKNKLNTVEILQKTPSKDSESKARIYTGTDKKIKGRD